ncbi:type 1 glutamine amidotransferase domain-containing protein [Pleionea sp. CnH1-48]|uniref:type 1 glutamine amidotransferase domain-containing protein n=1 Tax=Pleionea sp. CnH1-48 TaxID=2954494 RepID=UPI0020981B2E|nr:type 1 glutamine amidotransferase domain-containing protein [Pleionea sp. CnH1-48]MCO7227063.1 type 1 glutamine amidotransferase domain-containing protein [Pleionea sp. CnH1-48]
MRVLFIALSFLIWVPVASATPEAKKKTVAMLISSHAKNKEDKLSYDLEELAQAYLILHEHDVNIDILSPEGGSVFVKNNKDHLDYIQRFKTKTPALKKLASTISTKKAVLQKYDAVFVVGGDGAMFDLPFDKYTQSLLSHFAQGNKPIAAVCHGPAALINVALENGEFFIKNKKVNAFTNREEKAFGSDVIDALPFLLEDKLKQRGAAFVSNAPMLPYVAVDGNLITAQNPGAVGQATEALIMKMGVAVKPRTLYKDEATLMLVSQARKAGSYLIHLAMHKNPGKYDTNYLALYGFYAYALAQTKEDKKTELELMEAIAEYADHPVYMEKMIAAQWEQGDRTKAEKNIKQLKLKFPKHSVSDSLVKMLTDK